MADFSIYNDNGNNQNFDKIRISLVDPQSIEDWSYGEVERPDTVNYRTVRPEPKGLFCAKIFGPVKDYECLCGKYKRIKYKGVVCEKCGVEVTASRVRRDRMGHIKLASPIVHVWFLRSLPSKITTLLDMPLKDVERVLYFESYVVIDPGVTNMTKGKLLTKDEYYDAQDKFGEDAFHADIGAEAIKKMLQRIDLLEDQQSMRADMKTVSSESKRKKLVKRLKLVEDFIESKNRPEWMVLDILPVIPPDLRPLVMLDGGRFATSDLNELYRRVINRNNRLKRLIELKAPDIIIENEKRMLQDAGEALYDNGRRLRAVKSNKRPLKSLSDMLKGKQGRFRQNLLGKRVDYSGRSVIVVGPELKLHQCGLPKKMALELFKPFIYAKLELYGMAATLKAAKKMVETERNEVWDILEEVIREHPVLLNRAPTLHRLGIQAFEPVLIEGKAIQLHPLVCAAFNADFDGDQMAVHVPLSIEAQLEARVLMMSTNNILSPANGKPIIVPSQDMVLGLYYLTLMYDDEKGHGMVFSDIGEIEHALMKNVVSLHAKIKIRRMHFDVNGEKVYPLVETTPGRIILFELLPSGHNLSFDCMNKVMTKKELSKLIDMVYRHCGQKATVIFADNIMKAGFHYACKSGISFGKDDIIVPQTKEQHISETMDEVKLYQHQYSDGLITSGEKYNKVVDAWTRCTDRIASDMLSEMSIIPKSDGVKSAYQRVNALNVMVVSGARGSTAQTKQLAGMRGLMSKPSGEIIETPIKANFKEGLDELDAFISTHGARKGLADTALKTANSGYLTRKLVDVSQDCIVLEDDCGTTEGFVVRAVIESGEIVVPLSESILGRTAATDIRHPITNEIVIECGTILDERMVLIVESLGIDSVKVRSVLTCETKGGICSKCYGRDLATGVKVSIGEAVGVIAAQSIGEPGTQLTMRTFHIGGAAQKGSVQSNIISSYEGVLKIQNKYIVVNSEDQNIVMSRNCELIILDEKGVERVRYKVPYGARLHYLDDVFVKAGQKLADWDPYTMPVIVEKSGVVEFKDLLDGVSVREILDEATGITSRVIVDSKQQSKSDLRPRVVLHDDMGNVIYLANGLEARYHLAVNAILNVEHGAKVNAGDIIARIPKESTKTRDITGGLPRVVELFEARKPKDHSIISEIDGYVEFGKDYKAKRRLIVRPENTDSQPLEYFIPRGKHISVNEGDYVSKGDMLMEGNPSPHDILRVMGVEALAQYMCYEIQQVYRLQGVKIDDKHIEVVLRQMLQKVEVINPGETTLLSGDQVDKQEFLEINVKAMDNGYQTATAYPILQGITKASLQTRSFFSAASFQETTRVLTESAVAGKVDPLKGLKENVIVGRLIPAGLGFYVAKMQKIASLQDKEKISGQ